MENRSPWGKQVDLAKKLLIRLRWPEDWQLFRPLDAQRENVTKHLDRIFQSAVFCEIFYILLDEKQI